MKFSMLIALFIFSLQSQAQSSTGPKALYNGDSRVEVVEHPDNRMQEYAQSVAGMVRRFRLLDRNPFANTPSMNDLNREIEALTTKSLHQRDQADISRVIERYLEQTRQGRTLEDSVATPYERSKYYYFDLGRTLNRNMNICRDERFSEQPILPDCTGFLIAPDLIATAGHCVENEYQCQSFSWVFGFVEGVTRFPEDDVYHCKEIVNRRFSLASFITRDFAIIRLDRPVVNREPLPLRLNGRVRVGEPLGVIGHPSGLPMKVADDASVRRARIGFFYTDLDTFQGNSGSPVFNMDTGLVEGILVEGEEDYFFDSTSHCYRTRYFERSNRSNAAEKVFRINRIPGLKKLID
jgi:hypothetical protein